MIFALLKQEGVKSAQAARALGVSGASVTRWKQAYAERGEAGLAAKPHPGGQPRLTVAQRERLAQMLDLPAGPGLRLPALAGPGATTMFSTEQNQF
ncbi:MAG TPA: helix-turn-helix domain-containing protein [Phycisphaerae bacterium]|nr:helix-turn-helix domain-containing protein [Phycisphaerae bacterium]